MIVVVVVVVGEMAKCWEEDWWILPCAAYVWQHSSDSVTALHDNPKKSHQLPRSPIRCLDTLPRPLARLQPQ